MRVLLQIAPYTRVTPALFNLRWGGSSQKSHESLSAAITPNLAN